MGTNNISLFVPQGTDKEEILKMLEEEYKQTRNIKNRLNKARVTMALLNLIEEIKSEGFAMNGVVFYANDKEVITMACNHEKKLYWCDDHFLPINFGKGKGRQSRGSRLCPKTNHN